VDFEKGIDDRRGDVTVEQGLVGSHAVISSRPLTAVSSCLCRQGLSVAVPFSSSVHSRFQRLARLGHPSTAVSAAFPACRVSQNSLTQGCRRKVTETLYPVTDLVNRAAKRRHLEHPAGGDNPAPRSDIADV
jgi:hypothetical protein